MESVDLAAQGVIDGEKAGIQVGEHAILSTYPFGWHKYPNPVSVLRCKRGCHAMFDQ
ncbi:TPA: hypothetical protein PXN30_003380 [Yersinia enterocolitica]|uniref:hypothetical protein n=1 Tax=Yersinia TaxID=629 RepID=UPI00030CEE36|nr:hypothetical protein [Yersinia enterocolitica]EKN3383911.1 hypothetical protein [Yersinia enterocolitica]EKN3401608.1 hypothetical protein [Yersinia enterocolitica]EKN3457839.1 hypothetical protein [Yersinia enterocolitica]EKN3528604.1 hypothetical protein [Yersinia enterocolitica]EKN3585563.1 hypothetical protein [Yersinia enterocolitica]